MTEKVLPYDRSIVPQETGWWCGPAATQIVLNSRGIKIAEPQIAAAIEQIENPGRGDDRDGTDYVGLIERYLDRTVPQANYTSVAMPNDPPTRDQRERLWRDIKRSIDAGWGVVVNIVAPPSNLPAAVKASTPPPYPRHLTTYHYAAAMGYAEEAVRAVWVADSAAFGGITGWWCPLEGRGSLSSLIPPKGYCYADVAPIQVAPAPTPTPQTTTAKAPAAGEVALFESTSIFADPAETVRFSTAQLIQSIDARAHEDHVERRARRGDPDAIRRIATVAAGKGKYRDPATVRYAVALLADISGKPATEIASMIEQGAPT